MLFILQLIPHIMVPESGGIWFIIGRMYERVNIITGIVVLIAILWHLISVMINAFCMATSVCLTKVEIILLKELLGVF